MPVLYGEGYSNAFYRLQVEILQAVEDSSILGWMGAPSSGLLADDIESFGLFAAHPGTDASDLPRPIKSYERFWNDLPHATSSSYGLQSHLTGLKLQIALIGMDAIEQPTKIRPPHHYLALLPLTAVGEVNTKDPLCPPRFLTIPLACTSEAKGDFKRLRNKVYLSNYLAADLAAEPSNRFIEIRDVYVPSRRPTSSLPRPDRDEYPDEFFDLTYSIPTPTSWIPRETDLERGLIILHSDKIAYNNLISELQHHGNFHGAIDVGTSRFDTQTDTSAKDIRFDVILKDPRFSSPTSSTASAT